jgi:hypothetical protein
MTPTINPASDVEMQELTNNRLPQNETGFLEGRLVTTRCHYLSTEQCEEAKVFVSACTTLAVLVGLYFFSQQLGSQIINHEWEDFSSKHNFILICFVEPILGAVVATGTAFIICALGMGIFACIHGFLSEN